MEEIKKIIRERLEEIRAIDISRPIPTVEEVIESFKDLFEQLKILAEDCKSYLSRFDETDTDKAESSITEFGNVLYERLGFKGKGLLYNIKVEALIKARAQQYFYLYKKKLLEERRLKEGEAKCCCGSNELACDKSHYSSYVSHYYKDEEEYYDDHDKCNDRCVRVFYHISNKCPSCLDHYVDENKELAEEPDFNATERSVRRDYIDKPHQRLLNDKYLKLYNLLEYTYEKLVDPRESVRFVGGPYGPRLEMKEMEAEIEHLLK